MDLLDGVTRPETLDGAARQGGAKPPKPGREPVRIGLVNNMPDAAVRATERQFRQLLASAVPGTLVDLQLFAFDEIERGEAGRSYMASRYRPVDGLRSRSLDALIVTGAEPRAADLRDEPYWAGFGRLVDWAERTATPTVWSCMAAHAAVLHLDGIERRRLQRKCSGVFACAKASDDPLVAGLPEAWATPHSRLNTIDADQLENAGYIVASRAADAGVDAFVRRGRAEFVFFQGHPEYEADSLALEYQRDVSRYAAGVRETPPPIPAGYFRCEIEHALRQIEGASPSPEAFKSAALELAKRARPDASWGEASTALYAGWLARLGAG